MYKCKIKVYSYDEIWGHWVYEWKDLSGVCHTNNESAIEERYNYQYKQIQDGEEVSKIRIDEV